MEQPVLVRAHTGQPSTKSRSRRTITPSLPPISAYAFADIVRSADGPEFQSAIEGIAEICAKSRLSLAEEYAAHLPPVGEITEASSRQVGPQLRKPGLRSALTSVPEGSSGSSEGSRRSKRRNIFGFATQEPAKKITVPRLIRIGSMGRTISVAGTTAVAGNLDTVPTTVAGMPSSTPAESEERSSSTAATSLRRLLIARTQAPD